MSFALQEGTVFAGRYRIVRCIAMGGMGAVFEVVHLETERRRALKVMLPQALESTEMRERFKREARVAAQIESEFIVDVFDAGIDESTEMPFLVMELLRGEEIGQRLARLGRLDPAEVVSCLYQTALALDRTHKASIVHRDLKPENLFLTYREHGEPRIKVLDFGIAKFIAEHATNANATRSIGTPVYMAPEQFRRGQVTGAVDIYALGMIAYTLLVGIPYWHPEMGTVDNVFAFGIIAMEGPKESPVERAAVQGVRLPSGFDAWFARVTATDPTKRFGSATLAIEALADVLGVSEVLSKSLLPGPGLNRLSRPPGVLARTNGEGGASDTLPRNRGSRLAVGMAVSVLAIGGGTFAALKMRDLPPPPRPSPSSVTATASAVATAAPDRALPPSDSVAVQVAPVGSVVVTPPALPSVSAAGKPSSAPSTGPRKPPTAPISRPPATGKTAPPDSVYSRD